MKQAIVFCNSRHSADKLFSDLKNRFSDGELIHGGMEQSKRTSIIRKLRNRRIRFIVATDLAGRGLDFSHVSHVINYDFPRDPVTYTHRTGRAGRMGRVGTAVTFTTKRHLRGFKRIVSVNRIEPVWIGEAPNLGHGSGRDAPHSGPDGRSGSGGGDSRQGRRSWKSRRRRPRSSGNRSNR